MMPAAELLNHRNPSPDLAAALDRAPACQCSHCLHRRAVALHERLYQAALDREATGPIPTIPRP